MSDQPATSPTTKKVDKLFVALKAFVVRGGKILLLQESTNYDDGTNAGKWDVPGGRVTPGEQWDQALLREIKEETGLEVTIGKPFGIGEWRPQVRGEQWQVIATFVECQAVGEADVILSQDHAKEQWFTPEEVLILPNCASSINDAAKQYLKTIYNG